MSWGTSAYDWFGHTPIASAFDSVGKKAQQFLGLRRDEDDQEAIELANKQAQQNLELSRDEFEKGHQVAALDMSRAGLNPISATAQPSTYNASGGSSTPLAPNSSIAGGIAGIISSRITANKQEKISNNQLEANAPLVRANTAKAYADAAKVMTDVKNDPENQDLKRQQINAAVNELNKRAEESASRKADLDYQLEMDRKNGTYRNTDTRYSLARQIGTDLLEETRNLIDTLSSHIDSVSRHDADLLSNALDNIDLRSDDAIKQYEEAAKKAKTSKVRNKLKEIIRAMKRNDARRGKDYLGDYGTDEEYYGK